MTGERFTLDPSIKALLTDLGVSPARVLRRGQLATDLFGRDAIALSPDEYFRLWAALDAEGGDPNLAVAIGKSISVEMFSPPIFAALCSPDLETAAQRIATYKPLIGPVRLDVSRGEEGLTIAYRWPPGSTPPELLAATELVFWAALARIGTRHHVRPIQVGVPGLGPDHAALEDYFGVRVEDGPDHTITFGPEDAGRPFLTENEQMWRFFAPELRRRLSDLQAAASVADRVRAALHETLPAGGSSMTAVTRALAVSSRTLQRQLRLEGTTYQEVLASTREDLARHYLSHGTTRTAEIAYLLGYDDTNSFYRAFRTWTGMTPDAVRATAAAGT
ncbi:AraC family transcriptional regulator [Amycolatopsis echigonensis]|uniref:AraC family transcriptional regulator ligand-binding domain-containing protein n=1 Tax=Amycolatopsis echigonensis TaxID=2576905 RepID=A0A8E1W9V6_9PSEU|nr:AraC family transcriptional regulator [Amycolatopsis echigonensis]MBB2506511.1 AraC family transcriptional regulator ligand-binding domain-containing protein [Amycolatopsis echigonensis]